MKKTELTPLVQFLTSKGIDYKNAYRIVYLSKGTAAIQLRDALKELIQLRDEIRSLRAILKSKL